MHAQKNGQLLSLPDAMTDSDKKVSLRHSPTHFPEGDLVPFIIEKQRKPVPTPQHRGVFSPKGTTRPRYNYTVLCLAGYTVCTARTQCTHSATTCCVRRPYDYLFANPSLPQGSVYAAVAGGGDAAGRGGPQTEEETGHGQVRLRAGSSLAFGKCVTKETRMSPLVSF